VSILIAELVAAAVRERAVELEELVRHAVDVELERVTSELVERELELRRNGGAEGEGGAARRSESRADTPPPIAPATSPIGETPAPRVCRECNDEPALPGRAIGRRCKSRRDREGRSRARASRTSDEEPAPVGNRSGSRQVGGRLVGWRERDRAEQCRGLLAELRRNGVEHEVRDGREYVVLRLPDPVGVATPAPARSLKFGLRFGAVVTTQRRLVGIRQTRSRAIPSA
jgi:hypothetical protein